MEKYCTAGQTTDDNIVRCVRIACWIPKATKKHSEFVILTAPPQQQWLHEGDSGSRYTKVTQGHVTRTLLVLKILMKVNIEITVFLDVTPCTLV